MWLTGGVATASPGIPRQAHSQSHPLPEMQFEIYHLRIVLIDISFFTVNTCHHHTALSLGALADFH